MCTPIINWEWLGGTFDVWLYIWDLIVSVCLPLLRLAVSLRKVWIMESVLVLVSGEMQLNRPGCCVIISLMHTRPDRVLQYMEQMAGMVLNKQKYILITSLGYRHLLQLIFPFWHTCYRKITLWWILFLCVSWRLENKSQWRSQTQGVAQLFLIT